MTLFWMLLGLIGMILIDVPIAVALGLVAVVAAGLNWGPHVLADAALALFDGATKFTLIAIPLTFSIADGLALGFISYPIVKRLSGRGDEVHWLVDVLAVVFIAKYVFIG